MGRGYCGRDICSKRVRERKKGAYGGLEQEISIESRFLMGIGAVKWLGRGGEGYLEGGVEGLASMY